MDVFHVDSCAQAAHIFCDVVAEDYRTHRGLARAALAHEQHFFFLLTGVHVGIRSSGGRRDGWRFALRLFAKGRKAACS